MPSFEYQALTTDGRSKKGFLEADSERHARQQLRDDKLLPVELKQIRQSSLKNKQSRLFVPRIPSQQTALFARLLATLVDSAIPLDEALQAASEQTAHKNMRKIILAVRSRVREGFTLADSLAEHPKVFSDIFVSLVQTGERSGELGKVLVQLADYLEEGQQLRSTIIQGTAYPAVLTLVAISIVAILMSYVVPKVVAQFDHVNQQLPLLTEILIACSDGLQHYGLYLLLTILLAITGFKLLLRDIAHRKRWHKLQLSLPVVSGLIIAINSARMLRTLSILSASGIPLLDALKVASNTLTNLKLRGLLSNTTELVQAGSPLYKALAEQKLFPSIAIYMIANGEKSGELQSMLEKAATTQEMQLSNRIKMFMTLFEPALIIVLGVVVLMIVLAILLPILQLNNINPI